jgi:hypothetical protein
VHVSTHAPHFMQDMPARPLFTEPSSSTKVGQARRQATQSMHFSRWMRTSKTLSLLDSDWKAPNGHRNVHCVRRRVKAGITTTSPTKSVLKMPA